MLTLEELLELLNDLESYRVERTVSTTDTDKFRQAICAFANDMTDSKKPGYLVVGAKDDGSVAGIDITDQLLLNLASHRDSGQIVPLPAINVPSGWGCGSGRGSSLGHAPRAIQRAGSHPHWPSQRNCD